MKSRAEIFLRLYCLDFATDYKLEPIQHVILATALVASFSASELEIYALIQSWRMGTYENDHRSRISRNYRKYLPKISTEKNAYPFE